MNNDAQCFFKRLRCFPSFNLGRLLVRLVEEHLWFVAMSTELLEKGVLVARYSSCRLKLHSMRLQREPHVMNLLTASML